MEYQVKNMSIPSEVSKLFTWGLNAVAGRIHKIVHRPRKSASPFADRLLADALRIAEIPSPSPGEEKRAAFICERLGVLGLVPETVEGGLLVRIGCEEAENIVHRPPLLLFTCLSSPRWHPTESLAKLDRENAVGVGLAGALGPAALLSIAEALMEKRFRINRTALLFFLAISGDHENLAGLPFDPPEGKPAAAIGIQGLSLGTIVRPQGYCRQRITLGAGKDGAAETLIGIAGKLLEPAHDPEGEGDVRFRIRRIKAEAGAAAVLETELESAGGESPLVQFMDHVKKTAEEKAAEAGMEVSTDLLSLIVPGDPPGGEKLFEVLKKTMRRQHIRIREENGVDVAGLFSCQGIPSLSVGIALGKSEAGEDTIRIDSVEKGRLLLERFVAAAGGKL
jgi:hypothetical protein